MPEFIVVLGYQEVYKSRPTLETFQGQLGLISCEKLFLFCSVINELIRSQSEIVNFEAQNTVIKHIFPQELAAQLLHRKNSRPARIVFHRQQMLFMQRQALLFSRRGGGMGLSTKELGDLFLMANDLMHFENLPLSETKQAAFLRASIHLLAVQEAADDRVRHKLVRAFKMASPVLTDRPKTEKYWKDVDGLFEAAVGIPLDLYQALSICAAAKFMSIKPEEILSNLSAFTLTEHWFSSTTVAITDLRKYLASVSANVEELTAEVQKATGPNDTGALRKFPLLRMGDSYALSDIWLFAEKFESGPFWAIVNSLEKKEGDAFISFWGRLFELYIGDLFLSSATPMNRVYPGPKFVDSNEEFCDLLVICGREAICVECKGAFVKASAKYSGDINALGKELTRCFVASSDRPQAVYQLARSLTDVFGQKARKVAGVDLSQIRAVFPLIITRDDIGGLAGVNGFLQLAFNELIDRKKMSVSIAPLLCMTSDHAEVAVGYFAQVPFSKILASHIAANRRGQSRYTSMPFLAVENDSLKGRSHPEGAEAKAWHDLVMEAVIRVGLQPA